MATYTDNLNLKKPDKTDFVDIADINENMDAIDKAVAYNAQKITTLENDMENILLTDMLSFEVEEDGHLYMTIND